MSLKQAPTTMRLWQYSTGKGGLENTLKLNSSAAIPAIKAPEKEHLVQVISVCLNPVDYKVPELLPSFMTNTPATPGIDFAGRITTPAAGSQFKEGDLIFGVAATSPLDPRGALGEYAAVPIGGVAKVPEGVAPVDASTLGVAGLSAYQTIVPYIKKGDKVFINGGSGGVGALGIQIAKIKGCWVTTSCSTANVALCKSLGADEVIDYKQGSVLEALRKEGGFTHVVDNVSEDFDLYWQAHTYSEKGARFVKVAGEASLRHMRFSTSARLWPGILGGGKRKLMTFLASPNSAQLEEMGQWMAEGKLKPLIDSRFPFEEVPDAFRKLKTGRAKGKIVVDVIPKSDTN